MTYPFLSSFIKESFDGSFFSFVLGLFSSLPSLPSLHSGNPVTGRQGTAALVLLRLYGNAFKDRSGASFKGFLWCPFRKAGAKVHRLFHTSKYFSKFFSKIFCQKSESADFHQHLFLGFLDKKRREGPFSANQTPNSTNAVPTRAMGVRGSWRMMTEQVRETMGWQYM